jgi:hypothetical protein
MARDNGQGVFTMAIISRIAAMDDFAAMKKDLQKVIEDSSATLGNKIKATGMVHAARDKKHLLLGMSNFMLSHSGLKTIR